MRISPLEVARDDELARKLYRSLGFQVVATREGYFNRPAGKKVDALVLKMSLDSFAR